MKENNWGMVRSYHNIFKERNQITTLFLINLHVGQVRSYHNIFKERNQITTGTVGY